MATRISQIHKLGKHNKNQHSMNTNIHTVPVSILFCLNKDYKKIDMTLSP